MPWKVTYGHNFLRFICKVTGIMIICMTCMIEVLVRAWYVGAVGWECRN